MEADAGVMGDERGYTVPELLVAVAVIGLLIAISLPTFLGAQHRSEDRAVQSDLRTGLAAALTYFAQAGDWDGFDATQADVAEPTLVWVDGGPPSGAEIAIAVHAGPDLLLVRRSASGAFFCLAQMAGSPSTSRGRGASFGDVDTVAECSGGW